MKKIWIGIKFARRCTPCPGGVVVKRRKSPVARCRAVHRRRCVGGSEQYVRGGAHEQHAFGDRFHRRAADPLGDGHGCDPALRLGGRAFPQGQALLPRFTRSSTSTAASVADVVQSVEDGAVDRLLGHGTCECPGAHGGPLPYARQQFCSHAGVRVRRPGVQAADQS